MLQQEPESDQENDMYESKVEQQEDETDPAASDHPRKRSKTNKQQNPFVWSDDDFVPNNHAFSNHNSGCCVNLDESSSELDCFLIFFSEHIVTLIVDETNKYAEYLKDNSTAEQSRLKRWKNTNLGEIYRFFAINLLMPQVKKHKINDYWSKDFLLATPAFGQIMSRDRFLLLLRALHFVDLHDSINKKDSLRKIRPIVDHMKQTFKRSFGPFENICIDESLLLFKGRIFFKQYIPSKRHRFGIKFFLLCDSETGYVLDFIIYTGATTEINTGFEEEGLGKSGQIVLTLMETYLGKGHTLFLDNWYTSPVLFQYLYDRLTNCCGTVKCNRMFLPKLDEKLKKGCVEFKTSKNIMVLKWMDKREVRMLTTLHKNEMVETEKVDHVTNKVKKKPKCIDEYNKYMGAVDKSDLVLSSIESVRKAIKWYKKVFFHFLDLSVLNAWILYKTLTGKNPSSSDYQRELVRQILVKYPSTNIRSNSGRRPEEADNPMRLIARHFPRYIPTPPEKKKRTSRQCIVCAQHGKRKETCMMCHECNAALCVVPCFENFHNQKKY